MRKSVAKIRFINKLTRRLGRSGGGDD
jgi:hypothetical protein